MIESYRNIYSKLENIPTKYITAKQLSNNIDKNKRVTFQI